MASEKEIIKSGIDIELNEIVKYDEIIINLKSKIDNFSFNNLVEHVYCLNLVYYKYRRENLKNMVDNFMQKEVNFVDAVNGFNKCIEKFALSKHKQYTEFEKKYIYPKQRFISPGEFGTTMSYHNIFLNAKKNNYKYILCLEDDICVDIHFIKKINKILIENKKLLKEFKLLYLGYSLDKKDLIKKINNSISYCNGFVNGVFGCIIHNSCFDYILNLIENNDCLIDTDVLCNIQNNNYDKCFILNNPLIIVDSLFDTQSFNRLTDHCSVKDINENFKTNKKIKPSYNKKFNIEKENDFTSALHRYGWVKVTEFMKNNFSENTNDIIIDENMDMTFGWKSNELIKNNILPYKKNWIGFAHSLLNLPDWYDLDNHPEFYTKKNIFKHCLNNCKGIYVMSLELKDFFDEYFTKNNFNIKVNFIYHPISIDKNINLFDINTLNNNNFNILYIGWWGRKFRTLFEISKIRHVIWLNGNIDETRWKYYLKKELDESNINLNQFLEIYNNYEIKKVDNNEYDKLIIENIIVIDLYNTTTNNAILEAIMYNTPILVSENKNIYSYLGVNYPGYFKDLNHLKNILKDNNLKNLLLKCYHYLKVMNKDFLSFSFFEKSIMFSDIYQDL